MSAAIELTAIQKLRSHQVNCNKGCTRKKVVCPVGKLLLARAFAEPEASHKMKSFPFVAKMFERIAAQIGGKWIEAVVYDRSIQSPEMYSRPDETGTERWRTSSPKIVGYEIQTDDKARYYVRPYQIKSLRPRKTAMPTKTEIHVDEAGVARRQNVGGYILNNDLIILRRG